MRSLKNIACLRFYGVGTPWNTKNAQKCCKEHNLFQTRRLSGKRGCFPLISFYIIIPPASAKKVPQTMWHPARCRKRWRKAGVEKKHKRILSLVFIPIWKPGTGYKEHWFGACIIFTWSKIPPNVNILYMFFCLFSSYQVALSRRL